MNIVLFGPPGAGKGTQAKYLVKKINGFQISTGDMLRNEIYKNSEVGKEISNDMKDGNFVSDKIVNKLIKEIIFDSKKNDRLILFSIDGSSFPKDYKIKLKGKTSIKSIKASDWSGNKQFKTENSSNISQFKIYPNPFNSNFDFNPFKISTTISGPLYINDV